MRLLKLKTFQKKWEFRSNFLNNVTKFNELPYYYVTSINIRPGILEVTLAPPISRICLEKD